MHYTFQWGAVWKVWPDLAHGALITLELTVLSMLIGLAAGPVRPPLANVRKEEITELKMMLETWKPWL